uniref:Uncharacterized protein n=1 Tax=Anopheles minimus TaxID=112268 RepID=A0A182WA61_9DIPT
MKINEKIIKDSFDVKISKLPGMRSFGTIMADENELKELINQAITCEPPHVYGTVNLNRLREVLCFLVSARRPHDASLIANLSNQSLDKETESSHGLIRVASKEEGTCSLLQEDYSAVANSDHELDLNEVEECLNSASRAHSPQDVEQSCTLMSSQNILQEIDEIGKKVNGIIERIAKLETKSSPEECQCTCNCGVKENDANTSKCNVSYTDGMLSPKPFSPASINGLIFDVERDEPVSEIDGCQTTLEVVPLEAHGNLILKSAAISQSDEAASKGFKNNKTTSTEAIVSVQQDNGSVYEQYEESVLPASSNDTEHKEVTVEDGVSPKLDELVATVDGLVEREQMFFERLMNVEKLMSAYTDGLCSRLQEEKCAPPTTVSNDTNMVQNLRQKYTNTESPLGANALKTMRSTIDELQNEICFLKMAFNRLTIASGGKTDVNIKTHVKCISCNCAATMAIHDELIPTPVPFHARRCIKPMLRRQLDWLEKEMKHSAVAPVNMQPYYQLLKKNKLFPQK